MTFEQVAQDIAEDFIRTSRAGNTNRAALNVANEINSLYFVDGNKPLTREEKLNILELVRQFIAEERTWKYERGGTIIISEQKDNKMFLDMVGQISAQLNG